MEYNKENIRKWVEALRSDEFKNSQGRASLSQQKDTSKPTYCCLGVACEIYRRETGNGWWSPFALNYDRIFNISPINRSSTYLPIAVQEWLGFEDKDPNTGVGYSRKPLAIRNDEGESFALIADEIEREFLTRS